jgi:hypothetical protein
LAVAGCSPTGEFVRVENSTHADRCRAALLGVSGAQRDLALAAMIDPRLEAALVGAVIVAHTACAGVAPVQVPAMATSPAQARELENAYTVVIESEPARGEPGAP